MPFTPQQQAVIARVAAGDSLAVRAVAGSGKTTTLIEALSKVSTPGIALAFNKRNAEDLKAKLPTGSTIEAKTLNALGHRVWSDHLRKRLAVDAQKTSGIIKTMGLTLSTEEWVALVKMVGIAKARCIMPGILNRAQPDVEAWRSGAQQVDIPDDLFNANLDYAVQVLKTSVKLAWEGKIDYDDQLYMPVAFDSKFPTYPLVAVDEAQDLSPLQHEMVARLHAKQHVVVGDPAQAIYGFRGASESSYHELRERFELMELPLTVSFRCPRLVGEIAREYVLDFECVSGAPEGVINNVSAPALEPGVIICRYNAPLIRLAFQALRKTIPINYLGRDFIAGLKAIYKKAPTQEALDSWLAQRLTEAKTAGAKARATDQHASLSVLMTSPRPVAESLTILGTPSNAQITLSTVHKFKGMEHQNVTFLGYNADVDGGQERNLNYVGVTRSQNTLNIVKDR